MVCPACESNALDLRELIDVAEQHKVCAPDDRKIQEALTAVASKTALNYQMLRCRHCGLEFCDPPAAPSAEWYLLFYRALDLFSMGRWEFDEVIRRIPEGAEIFEFGCGSGNFLTRCQQKGRAASGMDFSEDAVASCVARGLAVRKIDLNAIGAESRRVSNIVAFHFVEHVERPIAFFEQAAKMAAPSAHLWVSVPSDQRPTRRFGTRDLLDQPPHHMTRWTPEAFRQIGKPYGWRLVETIYEPMSLRPALWSITYYSPGYRKRQAAGRFESHFFERAYRGFALPGALLRRLRRDRCMSGFSMLAHFSFEKV